MNSLYKEAGLSKQAIAQYGMRQKIFDNKVALLVLEADELREEHPGCGVEKMYYTLEPDFIGRDRFVELMMELGYRLKRKKNYKRTTIASKIYYPNLIKGMKVNRPSMIWQSDITYIPIGNRHYYAVFIIDVYTKKIVGYKVSDNMRAQANMDALNMALKTNDPPMIHHSDRGGQYIYNEYRELLRQNGSQISMALSAQDNAYAERINRTIKEEYLDHWKPKDFNQLKTMTAKAVKNYNSKRIHNNNERMSPEKFETKFSFLRPQERKLMTIFNNEN
jgi:transposase InsO family protein